MNRKASTESTLNPNFGRHSTVGFGAPNLKPTAARPQQREPLESVAPLTHDLGSKLKQMPHCIKSVFLNI